MAALLKDVTASGSSLLGNASRRRPDMCSDTAGFGASEECKRRWVAVPNRYATINGNLDFARHSVSREVGGECRKGKPGLSSVNY